MDWHPYKGQVLRYVERQSLITTSELVDRQADQLRLEELLEDSKPPAGDAQGLDWLLRSPFRYPPLPHGSRFGRRHERGIFYASETLMALEAEAAFYSFKFFQDMVVPPPSPIRRELTVIRAKLRTDRLVDISDHADVDRLVDPTTWAHSQPFGTQARTVGAAAIRFPSARVPHPARGQHCNLAVFVPRALARQGAPEIYGACTTVTDRSGVRLQGYLKQTQYYSEAQLRPRPWESGG